MARFFNNDNWYIDLRQGNVQGADTAPLSIGGWAYISSAFTFTGVRLFYNRGRGGVNGWSAGLDNGQVIFTTNGVASYSGTLAFPRDRFFYVALTLGTGGVARMYVVDNGALTSTSVSGATLPVAPTNKEAVIGNGISAGGTIAALGWGGGARFSSISLWNRVLPDEAIRNLGLGLDPRLLGALHFWPLFGAGFSDREPDWGLGLPVSGIVQGPTAAPDPWLTTRGHQPRPLLVVDRWSPLLRGLPPSAPVGIHPPPATITLSAAAPLLGKRFFITPPPATLTLSAPAPHVQPIKITAPAASATLSGAAPKVKEQINATPAATLTLSAARPAVVLDGFKVTVTPAALATLSAPPPTISLGVATGTIAAVTVAPTTDWRLVVCDLNGRPISIISALARNKEIFRQLNRPAEASFVVAGDDQRVNLLHTDGLPYIWPGARTMKWYRKEGRSWVIRFAGYMWAINPAERDADSSVVDIAVTCFDPMQRLMKRLCRDAAGSYASTVSFTSTPGATIAKTLVDRTIQYFGPVGIQTTGTFGGNTTPQTVAYNQAFIAQALIDLTNTMTLDLTFEPVDRLDGILASMGAVAQRGVDRPGVIFGYDAIPHSALGFNRSVTMDDFANDLTLYGANKAISAHRSDANSKARYGGYEDAQVLTEIAQQVFLDALADTDILLRKNPRDLIAVKPVPERSPSPWLDFNLGDRVKVEWSSNTGAAGSGMQRIYGYRLAIDDNNFERIDELIVSADAEQ